MRAWLTSLATLGYLTLAATSLTACQTDIVLPSGDVVYCTVMADPPVKDGKQIAAPGRYRCDGKGADTITITVTLQRKASDGSWQRVVTGTFVAHGANTTRVRTEGTRTRRVTTACVTGQFRTLVHAVEASEGNTQDYEYHSVTVRDPCRI